VEKANSWGKFILVQLLGSEETPLVKRQTITITKSTDMLYEVEMQLHVKINL